MKFIRENIDTSTIDQNSDCDSIARYEAKSHPIFDKGVRAALPTPEEMCRAYRACAEDVNNRMIRTAAAPLTDESIARKPEALVELAIYMANIDSRLDCIEAHYKWTLKDILDYASGEKLSSYDDEIRHNFKNVIKRHDQFLTVTKTSFMEIFVPHLPKRTRDFIANRRAAALEPAPSA